MSLLLQAEIEKLKKQLLSLSALVEETVYKATRSIAEGDWKLAQKVCDIDKEIDSLEVDLEEECLKVLALHQPVAADLRFIVGVLKINADLERIGDLSYNIAQRAVSLFRDGRKPIEYPFDFPRMAEKTQSMLRTAIDAFVRRDVDLAYKVCASDDEVDAMNRSMYTRLQEEIRQHPERLEDLIHLQAVSRHLERIADYATNIAEDVVYIIKGEIIRHRHLKSVAAKG